MDWTTDVRGEQFVSFSKLSDPGSGVNQITYLIVLGGDLLGDKATGS
jgi:hypothetical protein